jgi:hypothetical protein
MNTYTINISEEHLKVISAALVNGPYGVVAPVISHINSEIQKQFDAGSDVANGASAESKS